MIETYSYISTTTVMGGGIETASIFVITRDVEGRLGLPNKIQYRRTDDRKKN